MAEGGYDPNVNEVSDRSTSRVESTQYSQICRYDQPQEPSAVNGQPHMDKECGICLDAIGDNRFGILENCCHIFCLPCIRMWRQGKSLDFHLEKKCPMCRTSSDVAVPSKHWVNCPKEKEQLLKDYANAMKVIKVYAGVYLARYRTALRDIDGPTLGETITYLAKLTVDSLTQDITVSQLDLKNYWRCVLHLEANVEKALKKARESSNLDQDAMIARSILRLSQGF